MVILDALAAYRYLCQVRDEDGGVSIQRASGEIERITNI
jgi:hypothetical protein